MSAFRLIEAEKASHSVPRLCRMLGVSRSGYYAWRRRPPSERTLFDAVLFEKIETIHRNSRAIYGAPRVHAELGALGIHCGSKRVARLMRQAKLRGSLRGRRMRTTYRIALQQAAPDLLERNFAAGEPDRLWVADITYVRSKEGFVYLAFILQRVASILVRPQVDVTSAPRTNPSSRPHMCIMREGSCSVKRAVIPDRGTPRHNGCLRTTGACAAASPIRTIRRALHSNGPCPRPSVCALIV